MQAALEKALASVNMLQKGVDSGREIIYATCLHV
jgi:hypothetical protein